MKELDLLPFLLLFLSLELLKYLWNRLFLLSNFYLISLIILIISTCWIARCGRVLVIRTVLRITSALILTLHWWLLKWRACTPEFGSFVSFPSVKPLIKAILIFFRRVSLLIACKAICPWWVHFVEELIRALTLGSCFSIFVIKFWLFTLSLPSVFPFISKIEWVFFDLLFLILSHFIWNFLKLLLHRSCSEAIEYMLNLRHHFTANRYDSWELVKLKRNNFDGLNCLSKLDSCFNKLYEKVCLRHYQFLSSIKPLHLWLMFLP